MWTTLFVLAIAVNFEPTRIALVSFMLSGSKPIRQLVTFLACGFGLGALAGLLVLFVFDHDLLSSQHFNSAKIQIGIGAVLVLVAVLLVSNIRLKKAAKASPAKTSPAMTSVDTAIARDKPGPDEPAHVDQPLSDPPQSSVARIRARIQEVLHGKGSWFSGAAGLFLSMPSAEYLALLALIVASNHTPTVKTIALFTFLVLANAISAIPLISFLIAPTATRNGVQRFNDWVVARSRRQVASFLGTAGVCLVLVGVLHL